MYAPCPKAMDPGQPFTGGAEASKGKLEILYVRGFNATGRGMSRVQLFDLRAELVEITHQIFRFHSIYGRSPKLVLLRAQVLRRLRRRLRRLS
jgi:hypothetical protein